METLKMPLLFMYTRMLCLEGIFYRRQSEQVVYPESFVTRNISTDSAIQCGLLCGQEAACQAFSYVELTGKCSFIEAPSGGTDLGSLGLKVNGSHTFMNEEAMCVDPPVSLFYDTGCDNTSGITIKSLMKLMDNAACIAFLEDGTYVYCKKMHHLLRLQWSECEAPLPIGDIDPDDNFKGGPPDASVYDPESGDYLLIKGL